MLKIYENISLKAYNTFGIDAYARKLIEYSSIEELRQILREHKGERMLHIGQGSNLLITGDVDGIVLRSAMCRARALEEIGDEVYIYADNGLILDDLIAQLTDMGLRGMENLSYIPGTVGASAVQNVGAYGTEAKDVIVEVHTLNCETLEERVLTNEECRFSYRNSAFKQDLKGHFLVTGVVYKLTKHGELNMGYGNLRSAIEGVPTVQKVREAIIRIRKQKLPEVTELGSAGSYFKNPVVTQQEAAHLLATYPNMPQFVQNDGVKLSAAWLIDQLGWKGRTLGGAQVYNKQPLVIVNTGKATANDVIALEQAIVASVKKEYGIELHAEVEKI